MNAELLRTVLENPDEDLPRLVLADWLEENGQGERAEFIRVQCKMAAEPRRMLTVSLVGIRRNRLEFFAVGPEMPTVGERIDIRVLEPLGPYQSSFTQKERYFGISVVQASDKYSLVICRIDEQSGDDTHFRLSKRSEELLREHGREWFPYWRMGPEMSKAFYDLNVTVTVPMEYISRGFLHTIGVFDTDMDALWRVQPLPDILRREPLEQLLMQRDGRSEVCRIIKERTLAGGWEWGLTIEGHGIVNCWESREAMVAGIAGVITNFRWEG
jgi:uncharacterized protein (TIGR02996 family)